MQGNEAGTGGPGRDSAGAGAFALSDADLSVIGFVPAGATAPDDALAAVSTAPAAPGAALAADASSHLSCCALTGVDNPICASNVPDVCVLVYDGVRT